MSEWVDAPTGPGRWWRCVGGDASVLCDVDFGEATTVTRATRVDGLEVLYSTRPFAGVKWRRDVPAMNDETTRLRALLERAALPACEAAYDEDTGVWTVYPLPREQGVTVAEVAWSQAFCENGLTAARAQLFAAIPTALPGLLDAAERAEREHREAGESTRAAWRESERREQELRDRLIAAERERDDLAATLETRNAEHALAMARAREMEAVAREMCEMVREPRGKRDWCENCGSIWTAHGGRCPVGRALRILTPTAEVSR